MAGTEAVMAEEEDPPTETPGCLSLTRVEISEAAILATAVAILAGETLVAATLAVGIFS